jgi:methenyltetrahydrofolate cyclohydrolase
MQEPLVDKPVHKFLDELASAEPVPGGGSVAALGGAMAAALLSMVCRLTIAKKGYESVQSEMETLLDRLEPFQSEFCELMQADIDAYARVLDAYKLPKASDADKAARSGAIQQVLKHASAVPLRVAEECSALIDLARPIAEKGNKNAASDAGVGVLMAAASLRGAALNVSINLGGIKDAAFVAAHRERVAQLLAAVEQATNAIVQIVEGRM